MSDHRPQSGGIDAARNHPPTFNVTLTQAVLLQHCIEKQQDFLSRTDLAQHPAFHDDVETLTRWLIELKQINSDEAKPAAFLAQDSKEAKVQHVGRPVMYAGDILWIEDEDTGQLISTDYVGIQLLREP